MVVCRECPHLLSWFFSFTTLNSNHLIEKHVFELKMAVQLWCSCCTYHDWWVFSTLTHCLLLVENSTFVMWPGVFKHFKKINVSTYLLMFHFTRRPLGRNIGVRNRHTCSFGWSYWTPISLGCQISPFSKAKCRPIELGWTWGRRWAPSDLLTRGFSSAVPAQSIQG